MGIHIDSSHDVSLSGVTEGMTGFGELELQDAGDAPSVSTDKNTGEESIAENAARVAASGGELDIITVKKYIHFCRVNCSPRLGVHASDHNNILLCRDRHLLHIDFGFILGEAPKMEKVPIFSKRAPFSSWWLEYPRGNVPSAEKYFFFFMLLIAYCRVLIRRMFSGLKLYDLLGWSWSSFL
jgi:hypothetical protein